MASTLKACAAAELVLKKSRFLAQVEPCTSREAALARVAALRAAHPTAAHVCWALMAGGHSAAVDDGEPSGTAGRPMLDVLRHQGLEQVLATVVRYFGGVKLGAGGLVRAYTDAVATALVQAERVELVVLVHQGCRVAYSAEGTVRRLLTAAPAVTLEVSHGEVVTFSWTASATVAEQLLRQLPEALNGRLEWLPRAESGAGSP